MRRYPTLEEFIKGWKSWGLPALVGIFSPVVERFSGLQLVGDYYQPTIARVAAGCAALAVLIAYALLVRGSHQMKRRWLIVNASAFVATFVITRTIFVALGQPWTLSQWLLVAVRDDLHPFLYLATFWFLGSSLIAAFLLFPPSRRQKRDG